MGIILSRYGSWYRVSQTTVSLEGEGGVAREGDSSASARGK